MNNNTNNNILNNVTDDVLNFIKTKTLVPDNNINNSISNNIADATNDNKILSAINSNDINLKTEIANNEESNILINNLINLLKSISTNINLKEEDQKYLIQNVTSFMNDLFVKIEEHQLTEKQNVFFQIKQTLGQDFNKQILLIQRAFDWLGLNNLENKEEYINFFNKMAKLGTSLSEDQGIKHEQNSFYLTKEEAKKQRNNLIYDNKFNQALTNKSHPLHKDALNKLRNLNSIIVS